MKQQTENGENPVLKKEASDGKPKDPCIHEAFLGVPKQIISKTLCSPVPESMCLKDWLCAFCCLRPGCLEYPKNEKQPLVSGNNNQYKTYTVIDDDERNLWSSPHDLSHTEAVDDRMLHSWIQTRNQLEKDSEVRACRTEKLKLKFSLAHIRPFVSTMEANSGRFGLPKGGRITAVCNEAKHNQQPKEHEESNGTACETV
ncbi:hypothetical protein XELAEV_18044845mg [Xenopus laevis]|uniref:Uncharacterized protein n=1 Tax=Xenopus laevis TaxID=8355 RepID=A0A974H440_XENLA|nr:hypothetical protein XELAEV_18044845mg [Xenopus laevis]